MSDIAFSPALWAVMSAQAGPWLLRPEPELHLPAQLRQVQASRCVYVPMRQGAIPGRYLIDYVGSATRDHPGAAWQRVVNEHQRHRLERLAQWARIGVIALRDDIDVHAVRLIEAAVADVVGRPPRCLRLPALPEHWRAVRDAGLHAQA